MSISNGYRASRPQVHFLPMSHFVFLLHIFILRKSPGRDRCGRGRKRNWWKFCAPSSLTRQTSGAAGLSGGLPPSLGPSRRIVAGVTAPRTHSFGLNTSRREEREAGAYFPKTTEVGQEGKCSLSNFVPISGWQALPWMEQLPYC